MAVKVYNQVTSSILLLEITSSVISCSNIAFFFKTFTRAVSPLMLARSAFDSSASAHHRKTEKNEWQSCDHAIANSLQKLSAAIEASDSEFALIMVADMITDCSLTQSGNYRLQASRCIDPLA
jgi:hypothetical protein